jgi:hypothetical protein
MLLCDAAQSVGGKLFILGAGWSQIRVPEQPVNMALAIKISVPWDQANNPHTVTARLLDADGDPVSVTVVDEEDEEREIPIVSELTFETGRPPGLMPGTNLDAPLVLNFAGLALPTGAYEWRLEIDGNPEARTAFRVGPVARRR